MDNSGSSGPARRPEVLPGQRFMENDAEDKFFRRFWMEKYGSSGPAEQFPDEDPAQKSPAQNFMESDDVSKKANLDNVVYVTEIGRILPKDLNELDKNTSVMVLEKVLNSCGISTTTGEKTAEEAEKEQKAIQLQIEALKDKMKRNALILEVHRRMKESTATLQATADRTWENNAEAQQNLELIRGLLGDEHPTVLMLRGVLTEAQQAAQAAQEELDATEYPLRD